MVARIGTLCELTDTGLSYAHVPGVVCDITTIVWPKMVYSSLYTDSKPSIVVDKFIKAASEIVALFSFLPCSSFALHCDLISDDCDHRPLPKRSEADFYTESLKKLDHFRTVLTISAAEACRSNSRVLIEDSSLAFEKVHCQSHRSSLNSFHSFIHVAR